MGSVEIGFKKTGYENLSVIRTFLVETEYIYPYLLLIGYKNISVI